MRQRLHQTESANRGISLFDREVLPPNIIKNILSLPVFRDIDLRVFPKGLTPGQILQKSSRIIPVGAGELVYAQGQYETSIYYVLRGSVSGVIFNDNNSVASSENNEYLNGRARMASYRGKVDVDQTIATMPTTLFKRYSFFGETEALARCAREYTVFSNENRTLVLEIKWSGLRELARWSDALEKHLETQIQRNSISTILRTHTLFQNIDEKSLKLISASSSYVAYGERTWSYRYQKENPKTKPLVSENPNPKNAPLILKQGQYLDDIMIVHGGLISLASHLDSDEQIAGVRTRGAVIGLEELVLNLMQKGERSIDYTLRANGYASLIKIPTHIIERYVLPRVSDYQQLKRAVIARAKQNIDDEFLEGTQRNKARTEFAVTNRLTNGTAAMAINTDRCVNCDDCVAACAATHDNIPRFDKQKGYLFQNLKVTNACMHCEDPVCLIDCPTDAIHRNRESGEVVIDYDACIGCTSCANACPYDNIEMLQVGDTESQPQLVSSGIPSLKAVKCDLCSDIATGPACQQACSYDALIRIDLKDTVQLSDWLRK